MAATKSNNSKAAIAVAVITAIGAIIVAAIRIVPAITRDQPAEAQKFGPYDVYNASVNTGIKVQKGDAVRVVSEGTVNFGGGLLGAGDVIHDANGDNNDKGAPSEYPAPALCKNSLICKVQSRWLQGGTNATFIADEDGELILHCNDANRDDNKGGWRIFVYVTH